jgi:hypothetical protein
MFKIIDLYKYVNLDSIIDTEIDVDDIINEFNDIIACNYSTQSYLYDFERRLFIREEFIYRFYDFKYNIE